MRDHSAKYHPLLLLQLGLDNYCESSLLWILD